MKKLALLGATGSIGTSTAEVVRAHPDRLKLETLAAFRSVDTMRDLVEEFQPSLVAMGCPDAAEALARGIPSHVEVRAGVAGVVEAATHAEVEQVVSAMVGACGLEPVYAAVEAGKDIALANKEVLVAGGDSVLKLARQHGAKILPVDSEHSALFQALGNHPKKEVHQLWLTASGGPFRGKTRDQLADVAPAQALKHPTWNMGAKITIDSASLMNKGLEVIEAHWLFGIPFEKIQVVVHPQSIVHSLVEFIDGSWLGHLGVTDMKVPIQYALSYPERWDSPYLPSLNITQLKDLTFEAPDPETFENLALAYEAGRRGKTFACVLSAANEIAVEAFLAERIGFLEIPKLNREVMEAHQPPAVLNPKSIVEADAWAREEARRRLGSSS